MSLSEGVCISETGFLVGGTYFVLVMMLVFTDWMSWKREKKGVSWREEGG